MLPYNRQSLVRYVLFATSGNCRLQSRTAVFHEIFDGGREGDMDIISFPSALAQWSSETSTVHGI